MRLIEKECPNCGAGLHFTKDDTTCKCEYCKREFEIERDTEKKKLDEQYILNELKTPFKIFSYFTLGSFLTQGIIILISFIIIAIVGLNIVRGLNDSNSIFNRNANLITSTSDLSSNDYNTIDINSRIIVSKSNTESTDSYVMKGFKREKLYIISNKNKNYLIAVYKATYKDAFNNSDEFTNTVYIPIEYKNVKTKYNSISLYLNNGELIAPECYFNLEHSDYAYGYKDMDTLYNEIIKQYENDYKIVQK